MVVFGSYIIWCLDEIYYKNSRVVYNGRGCASFSNESSTTSRCADTWSASRKVCMIYAKRFWMWVDEGDNWLPMYCVLFIFWVIAVTTGCLFYV